ncbi:MAG: YfhO family protein [Chloroflexi bacterium]|nr:YfhO family protein [Chloroflexota bacterium]
MFGFALLDRATGRLGQFYLPAHFRSVYEDADDRVLENTSVFPAAFIVPEAVTERTAEAALERMTHGAFQPRRQVVLEDPNAMQAPATSPVAAPSPAIGEPYGRVDILSWADESRSLRVSSDGGYLVVTEADYPGWLAYVDGVPTEVLRGDYLFQTVPLGPGEQVVELRYEPASFWSGLAISRVALGLAVLAILVSFVRLGRGSEHWTRAG